MMYGVSRRGQYLILQEECRWWSYFCRTSAASLSELRAIGWAAWLAEISLFCSPESNPIFFRFWSPDHPSIHRPTCGSGCEPCELASSRWLASFICHLIPSSRACRGISTLASLSEIPRLRPEVERSAHFRAPLGMTTHSNLFLLSANVAHERTASAGTLGGLVVLHFQFSNPKCFKKGGLAKGTCPDQYPDKSWYNRLCVVHIKN